MTDKAREQFEKWLPNIFRRDGEIDEDGDFYYFDDWVQGAWVGYRAALRTAPAIDLELVREAIEAAIALAGPNDGNLEGWRGILSMLASAKDVDSE